MISKVLGGNTAFKWLKKNWGYVVGLIIFIIGVKDVRRIVKQFLIKSELAEYEVKEPIPDEPGSGINLKMIAFNIYDAFYNRGKIFGFGLVEDEEYAIEQLKRVPRTMVSKLAREYSNLHAKKALNLYTDFREYLNDKQFKQVENLLT